MASIKLVNGNNSCSGRVEVYHQWWWGTVCDNGWDLSDAAVVCRELGCGDVIEAKTGAYFGQGSGKIWMADVSCVGNESTLSSCESRHWEVNDCDHSKDAGVICQSLIRLVNGSNSCSGRVEVLHDGQWGTVCDDGWDWNDATVVCREMGCGNVIETKSGAYFGQGSGPVWLSDLQCYSSESTLSNCQSSGWGHNSCGHEKEAGVICQLKTMLVDGFSSCSGRVEVYRQWMWWGTVCDNGWDLSDAAVVCKEVGCGDVIEANSGASFGQGSGQIWMANVSCVGDESTLSSCESSNWAGNDCDHSKDAGVICQSLVRLVNGINSCSGRVEVFYNGTWGTVCDDGWDWNDARVACREMGCGDVIEIKTGAYFGQGSGPVWLSDLQCYSSVSTLSNCQSSGWGRNSCGHEKDAGVVCQPKVQLVNGFNSCSGRVEVYLQGRWRGTVCDNGWDLSDAAVVCRELGCGDVIATKTGAYFGQGSGLIRMADVNCVGDESTLSSCGFRNWGVTDCDHSKDAGVICQSLIRLVNGINSCSGRVEVFYDGQWGTVCDNGWDQSDAAVVCREMGCGDVKGTKSGAFFGQGTGPVWLSDLQCVNTEYSIRYCHSKGRGENSCGHEKDAGVICNSKTKLVDGFSSCSGRVEVFYNGQWGTVCDIGWDRSDAAVVCREVGCGDVIEEKKSSYFGQGSGSIWMADVNCVGNETTLSSSLMRLVNSSNSCSGRVEVLYNGTWGTVCDNGWDLSDAAVVCSEMACGDVIEAKSGAYFGQGSGPVWMSDLQCSNTESSLRECTSSGWGTGSCGHEKDAGVICQPKVQLVNGFNTCSGRVEVYRQGWWWGTVCDNGWDLSDAAVVCRELGCGDVIAAKTGAHFGQGSASIWMAGVNCVGDESTLSSCGARKWGVTDCDHSKDAGVICQSLIRLVNGINSCSGRVEVFYDGQWGTVCDNGWDQSDAAVVCREMGCGDVKGTKSGAFFGQAKTKLVDGFSSCSGRVEVFYNGQWGTVCDIGWDRSDAAVVCREMGCGDVIEEKKSSYFGQGSGSVWVADVNCVGNETTLGSCKSPKWGMNDCDHSKDAGVICQSRMRLVNSSNSCSGRVEVLYNGTWGTVCDNGWDLSDAAVVCSEMACGDVIEAKSGAYFGQGSGPVWMSDLQCSNTESSLRECTSSGWGTGSCGHEKDAGVICQRKYKHFTQNLVNGFNSCSGRVEVYRQGLWWGTVCDNGWDLSDAAVVCRELGCGDVIAAKTGAHFGQGSASIWMAGVNCVGDESTLSSCGVRKWGVTDCDHSKDAGVICQSLIRLVNGINSCSGRVEVFYDGQWGTVCDNGWDLSDAAVVCREMGCGDVKGTKSGAFFGQGTGPVWLSDLQCVNTEYSIRDCHSEGRGEDNCGHEKDAGVICNSKTKLVDGFNSCSGRVEVFYNGQWGTVCDNGWDLSDAAVVCREMGCGDVIEEKKSSYFGQGSGSIWMADVNCVGNETAVNNCESRKWGMNDCDHSKDAGVICQSLMRLVNSSNSCSGRVEVLYNGTWGTVCDNGWDLLDAAVVCSEMACGDVIEAKSGAYFGQGSGPVWMSDLQCSNTESSLRECTSSGWGTGNCGHKKDAGVICKNSVRLVNGSDSCSGRVEVLRNGIWGTVCDDGWDLSDAAVVCRELDCGRFLEAKTGAYFGQGSGSVWIKNVKCVGTESDLMSCPYDLGSLSCGHEKDAGVICGDIHVHLRIEVKAAPGVDPNDPKIMKTLLKEIEKKVPTDGISPLRWKTQSNGTVFQNVKAFLP
ncbi:deleted in malignant brain tumors 1 protein-like [Myxocyprinus asiaticus]|uniref:deleted in malignant brain tumors 1 protein-like n=1 Tax=Myxocyprinus asiaticus TaxID=70543 RepID=UPI002221AC31|nr:deleted in malignant brain tumors 1 protein-like [Myxocyprinus asiaticus]